jgi:YggT family protein
MMVLAAITRNDVANYVRDIFYVYIILLFAYLLTNMLFSFGARPPYARWSEAIFNFLRDVSEPYLRLFRKIMPPMRAIDLSPMLALIVLYVLMDILHSVIAG